MDAFLEGPYGSPAIDLLGARYRCVLLISGGIGITPIQAMFNELLMQASAGRPLRRLALVWAVRDRHMVDRWAGRLPLLKEGLHVRTVEELCWGCD